MSKHIGVKVWSMARRAAGVAVVVAAILLSIQPGFAQEEPVSPPQAREALRRAIEAHNQGDYETALGYLQIARQGQKSLSPAEQADFTRFSTQNAAAIKGRQEGTLHLKQAADALQQGKTKEAAALLKSLESNQFLSGADRQQMNDLNGKVQKQSIAAAPPAPKGDAKALLNAGRAALQKGMLDEADALAIQAEKASSGAGTWYQPWSDSPSKLRRDVQAARAAQTAKAEPDKGSSWLPSLPSWLSKSDNKPQQPTATPAKAESEEAAIKRRVDEKLAREVVLRDAFMALQQNDLEKAKFLAIKCKELCSTWTPNEPNPDQILQEIQRRTGTSAPASTTVVMETKAAEAKPLQMPNSTDPRVLLRFGRELFEKKQYDDADKVCGKVLTMQARWGLWEDTPEKLRRDIQRTKMYADREDSVKVMAEARKLFTEGKLDDAERKAYQAQRMHGPYGVFDMGDRPATLLEEIRRAKLAKGATKQPEKTAAPDGAANVIPAGAVAKLPPVSAGMQNQDKNRAIVMVREARDLERQGKWMDARQKALEARQLRAVFAPEEDSPDAVLLSLSAKIQQQIQDTLRQIRERAANPADPQRFDTARRQMLAAREMAMAFELDLSALEQTAVYLQQLAGNTSRPAVASDLPPLAPALAPLMTTPMPPMGLAPTGDPEKDRYHAIGREKLRDAQTELSHGHTAQARRMAEEIYDAKYGVQEEVRRLLHSIGNEEYNQRCLAAKRNFDAGVDAFVHKDYRQAQTIFGAIDVVMLPEQYQARMREIMACREMQPETIVKTGYQQPIKGQPLNIAAPGGQGKAGDGDLIDELKARETVLFQQLRQRSLEAQRTAHELFKNKQRDQAMVTLSNFLEQVNDAQLSPDKANLLRRPIEAKIQQYKVLIATETWDKQELGYKYPYGQYNPGKTIEEKRKFQAKIKEMLDESLDQYKHKKFKESIEIARKVHELDPDNVAAAAMVQMATTAMRQREIYSDVNANEENFYKLLRQTPGDTPYDVNNAVVINKDVSLRNSKRADSGAIRSSLQNPKERAIEYRLMQPLSLNFKDVPLQQAIREISLQSGIQVIPDTAALMQARINLDAPISGTAENVSMKSALNIVFKQANLTYIIEDEVLKITTSDRTTGRVMRVVYPVADLIAIPEDHPLPDVWDIQKAVERVNSNGAGMPSFAPPPAYMYNAGTPVSSHSQGLGSAFGTAPGQSGNPLSPSPLDEKKHKMGEVLVQLVKSVVRKDSWADFGGAGDIHYTPFGMALVVNQVLDVQKDVEDLLASLRQLQDLQVAVELRAVLVSESFFERIGVDFNMNILTPDGPGKQALAAGNLAVASANKTITGYTQSGQFTPDLNVPINNNTFNLTQPQFGGYQPGAGLSLGLAFLSEIQVFMFLEAVAGDQRAHVMQAPKLTVYNGQFAFITANVSRPFMAGVTPLLAPNGYPVMIPQMTVYPLGLGMTVQPVVSPDRRFVRLNITPILTSGFVDPAGQIIIPTPYFPINGVPPIFTNGNLQPPLPTIPQQYTNGLQFNPLVSNVNVVNTTVNVPDGGTVLMGGFKFLAEQRSEYGPPVLSQIPYLSRLFRNVGWSRDSSTLLYLVTARIIMVEEEERIFLGQEPAIPGR